VTMCADTAGRRARLRAGLVGAGLLALCVLAPVASAQNPNWPSERPPRPLAPKEVPFPPYEVRTLPNGMQVMTVLHHEQPAVTMHLLVRAGGAQDPDGRSGLAVLASRLLDQGTTTRSAEAIADQIDLIGGSLSTGSGPDRITASTVVMKDSFAFGMELLADVVRNPAFHQEEIDRQKEQLISTLQVSAGDPDYVANIVFDRLVYGFHPYGRPGSGTPESLAGVTREDLREFHRRHFVPNNMILAIVGDVTRDEAFAMAQKMFGDWPRGTVPAPAVTDPPPPTRRVIVIDKPDSVQTEVRVGGLAIPRKHDDFMAWNLAIRILGGEGANRLHRVLRSERGLTYGASADTRALKQAGDYVAETDTRTETTAEALNLMVGELLRLRDQPVSERELGDAQAYVAGSFPLTIETPVDIASQVLHAVFYELPLDEISTYVERVRAITPRDVQRVARQYIRPDNLSVVLVGNADAFVPQLRKFGLTSLEVIPIDQLDLSSPTLRRDRFRVDAGAPAGPPAASGIRLVSTLQATPRAGAPAAARQGQNAGAELVRRVVLARGGLENLKAIRTVVAETDTTFMDEQGQVAATTTTTTYVQYPDKFRVDANIQDAVVSQVFNAGMAWEQSPVGVRDLPEPVRDEMATSVRRDMIPLLIAAAEGQLSVRVLPDEAGAGGRRVRVIEITGAHLDALRLHIDDDMLIVKQVFWIQAPDGRRLRAEESFDDYRVVDNVRVPFDAAVSRDGRIVVRRQLTSVAFNRPLAPSLFERPRN
jgi:zinc protease